MEPVSGTGAILKPEGYCCEWDVVGRELVVSGVVIAPPVMEAGRRGYGGAHCGPDAAFHGVSTCEFGIPWRSKLDAVAALGVRSACTVSR